MRRLKILLAATVVAALFVTEPARAVPVASFTYEPALPLTGELVTFTSTSTGGGDVSWDLDGAGACDDATGPVASRSFPLAGSYDVRICINGDEATQKQTIAVLNRPPLASFAFTPSAPLAGDPVKLTATAGDADGPITAYQWDLDADGAFDDAAGAVVSFAWTAAGSHRVALRVTDRDGATADASASIEVRTRPPALLSPFPTVRLVGRLVAGGAAIQYLAVSAPSGSQITLRCRGRDCPYRRKRRLARDGPTSFPRLHKRLRAGTVLEIRVKQPGTIGKYTRFRIWRDRRPTRVDRCLDPAGRRPVRCPGVSDT